MPRVVKASLRHSSLLLRTTRQLMKSIIATTLLGVDCRRLLESKGYIKQQMNRELCVCWSILMFHKASSRKATFTCQSMTSSSCPSDPARKKRTAAQRRYVRAVILACLTPSNLHSSRRQRTAVPSPDRLGRDGVLWAGTAGPHPPVH